MSLRFTLRQIEYFVAVGEVGSIALAAERLHISSPSISAAISQLERTFELKLFVRRHAQGVSLTREGRRFLGEAKSLLAQAQSLHGVASELSEEVRGSLNVGCLVTLAPMILPEVRRSFERLYPNAEIRQHIAHQPALLDDLREARLDLVLTYDLEIPAGIDFEPLARLPLVALFPARHRLARSDSVSLDTLAREPLILLDLPLSREYFLSLFRDAGVKPRIAERIPDLVVIRAMVANGFGYSLANVQPRSDRALDGRRFATVPVSGDHQPMTLGIATARAVSPSRIVDAFAAHCRAEIGDGHVPGMASRD